MCTHAHMHAGIHAHAEGSMLVHRIQAAIVAHVNPYTEAVQALAAALHQQAKFWPELGVKRGTHWSQYYKLLTAALSSPGTTSQLAWPRWHANHWHMRLCNRAGWRGPKSNRLNTVILILSRTQYDDRKKNGEDCFPWRGRVTGNRPRSEQLFTALYVPSSAVDSKMT